MARFTERPPTIRETRRGIVAVLEQLTVPPPDGATGLALVERIYIADLRGSHTVRAELIDWTGRTYETRVFPSVDEAKALYLTA